MIHATDIDELVQRVRNALVREYMEESLASFRVGAYRAAIISTWIAVCLDILEKIHEMALSGDASAQQEAIVLSNIRSDDFLGMQTFERKLLHIAHDSLKLISHQEKIQLERLREDRNFCSHPSFHKDVSHFAPSVELAKVHIVQACQILLIHQPMNGKVIVDSIYKLIQEESFPEDPESAFRLLSSNHYLGRGKDVVFRNLLVVLLKRIFLDEEKLTIPKINKLTVSISAISRFRPEIYKSVCEEKLNMLLSTANDQMFRRVFFFLPRCSNGWIYLENPMKLRIGSLIENLKSQELISCEIVSLVNAIEELKPALVKRFNSLTQNEKHFIACSPSIIFKEFAIDAFTKSASFASAYSNGQHFVLAYLDLFNEKDVEKILEESLVNDNNRINQVLNAGGIDEIFIRLFRRSKNISQRYQEIWRNFWHRASHFEYNLAELRLQLEEHNIIEVIDELQVENQSDADVELPF